MLIKSGRQQQGMLGKGTQGGRRRGASGVKDISDDRGEESFRRSEVSSQGLMKRTRD